MLQCSDSRCSRRCLVLVLLMPILLLISVVGMLIWLLLLPVKCCCCPCGCLLQCVANAVEWLVKAPVRGVLWMTGSPWQPAPGGGDVEAGGGGK